MYPRQAGGIPGIPAPEQTQERSRKEHAMYRNGFRLSRFCGRRAAAAVAAALALGIGGAVLAHPMGGPGGPMGGPGGPMGYGSGGHGFGGGHLAMVLEEAK